jgi:hypothetical protein
LTRPRHHAIVPKESPPDAPLASFVLRVRGQPARLTYELHNVRTGERKRFTRLSSLVAFLREQGIEQGDMPIAPGDASD